MKLSRQACRLRLKSVPLSVVSGLLLLVAVALAVDLTEEDRLQFADGLYARGMYELAAKEYRGFLDSYPNSASGDVATFRLAESYRQLHNLLEAEKTYRTVFNRYPNSEHRLAAGCKRADLFIETGQYDAAIDLFGIVLDENPPADVASSCHYFKGEAYLKSDRPDEAAVELEKVVNDYAGSRFESYALLKLGTIWARERSDADKGRAFFLRAVDKAKTDRVRAEALFQVADSYYRQDAYEKSAEYYRRLLSDYPEDERAIEASLQAAWASYRSGFYAEALEHSSAVLSRADRASETSGVSPETLSEWLYLKANCERQLMQNGPAAETYEKLIETYPRSLFAHAARYEQAVALFKMGEYERAIEEASNLRAEGALGKDLYWLLAESYAALNREQEAIQYYRLLTRNYPESDVACDAHFRLGHQLQSVGNNKEAVAQYQLVANEFPEHDLAPKALFAAAICQMRDEAYAAAARDLQVLVERYPASSLIEKSLYQRAMCELRLDRNDDALISLQKLLTEFPAGEMAVDARYWLGMLLLQTDQAEDAEKTLRACLALTPRDELQRNAGFYLGVALQKQGKYDEALASFVPLLSTPAREKFSPDLLVWMAESLLEKGAFSDASTAAQLLLNATDEAKWRQIGWGLLGQSETAQGHSALAQDAFRKVLECDAQTRFAGQAALHLGEAAFAAKDFDRAEAYFGQAASFADDQALLRVRADAYAGLGRTARARNDLEEAARYFMSVAVLYDDPTLVPSCLVQAADCFRELGNADAASRAMAELVERYPDRAEVKQPLNTGE